MPQEGDSNHFCFLFCYSLSFVPCVKKSFPRQRRDADGKTGLYRNSRDG